MNNPQEATVAELIDILCDIGSKEGFGTKVRYEVITNDEPPVSTHNPDWSERIKLDVYGYILKISY